MRRCDESLAVSNIKNSSHQLAQLSINIIGRILFGVIISLKIESLSLLFCFC
jgi:hypothetical protein